MFSKRFSFRIWIPQPYISLPHSLQVMSKRPLSKRCGNIPQMFRGQFITFYSVGLAFAPPTTWCGTKNLGHFCQEKIPPPRSKKEPHIKMGFWFHYGSSRRLMKFWMLLDGITSTRLWVKFLVPFRRVKITGVSPLR